MENLGAALIITVIGMTVIFVVLIMLLVTIILLNKLFPYQAPAPKAAPAGGVDDAETVAVIHAALTKYLGREPGKISVKKAK